MDEATQMLHELGGYVQAQLPNEILQQWTANAELNIYVCPAGIQRVLKFLKKDSNCLFEMLMDICGVDYPDREIASKLYTISCLSGITKEFVLKSQWERAL